MILLMNFLSTRRIYVYTQFYHIFNMYCYYIHPSRTNKELSNTNCTFIVSVGEIGDSSIY